MKTARECLMALYDNWGKPLNEKQVSLWLDELQNYSIDAIRMSIKRLLRESKTFPSLSDLLAYCNQYQELHEEKHPCEYCQGAGMVIRRKEVINEDGVNILDFAYRCACRAGDKYKETLKEASDEMLKQSYSVR